MLRKSRLLALIGAGAALALGYVVADDRSLTAPSNSTATKGSDEQIDIQRLSEAFGHFIGRNLNTPGFKFDLESIIKGMRDGSAGKPSPMSDQDYEVMMAKVQEKAFTQAAEDNLTAANAFLQKNAKEAKVTEIEPGKLQYTVLQEGNGPVVSEHGSPLVQYKGTYLDGTVFGSSEDVGGALTVPLDQTIPGFSKGIAGMKQGEKRRLFVHPDLGYGTSGQLAPNSLLIFDVEVIKSDNSEANNNTALPNYSQRPVALDDTAPVNPKAAKTAPIDSDDEDYDDEDEDEDDDLDSETTPAPVKSNQVPAKKA